MMTRFKMSFVLGVGALLCCSLSAAPSALAKGRGFRQADIVSDIPGIARITNPDVVNPWGILIDGDAVVVALNGTGRIVVYQLGKYDDPQVIAVPPTGSSPTGIVLNNSGDFVITKGTAADPARYIVATEDGTIAAWVETVDPDNAIEVVDNSADDAIYKGLALGKNAGGSLLYATDFHNNKVDAFDKNFNPLFSFTDDTLPPGYAPFGITVIDDVLYVTFALQDDDKEDDVPGVGNGYVDVFDADGNMIRRFASQGTLNSPWGIVRGPDDFGGFTGTILIGNFGDGMINGFLEDGTFEGRLKNKRKQVITIDGLWGLATVNHDKGGDTLLFTAGLAGESHGLIGRIRPRGED